MNHHTFKGLVKHVENWSAAAESRDKRLWKLYLLSSCLSRHQTCAEFHLCDSVRNKTKWKAKNQTHLTATLNEEWCNADSIILNSFPLDCIHNTDCRQLNIFECMCTCISMNDSDCTHTVCACMFFSYPEGCDLLLSLSGGLLQLGLCLLQLALQGKTSGLQAANLGLALLQGEGQFWHLPLDLQLLFFVF